MERNQRRIDANARAVNGEEYDYDAASTSVPAEEDQRSSLWGNVKRGAAALGIIGSLSNPGMAAGALQGDNGRLDDLADDWRNSAQTEQRNSQTRGHRSDTTYKGRQRGGSSGRE
ncbi:hypothetical protein [Streptomyces umbrinus]|uniref:hypothetical protein n=1 Tax=Streptomyces umbrinus TaxID=67370 RepID=UPI0033EB8B4C